MKDKKITIKGSVSFGFFDLRLLKKSYCCKCGAKLSIKYPEHIILKEYKLYNKKLYYRDFYYHCENCDYYIKYKNQKLISRIQRERCLVKLEDANNLILKNKVRFSKVGKELFLNQD